MAKKVTDEELLAAVWRKQIEATARGAISKYVGSRFGLAGESLRRYGQDCHIISRERLGIPLSAGHLRKRIVRLIDQGRMAWVTHDCTFWIDCPHLQAAYQHATRWWEAKGVPGGFDEERKAMRCVPLDNFESLVTQLKSELLSIFGEYESEEPSHG